MKKKRRAGLDTIRGLALLSMTAYHACWDLVWTFGLEMPWYQSFGAYVWQQGTCWTFLLLSGYCWTLGRRKLWRGLASFGGGMLVTAVTVLFMPENLVFCGVLTLLGTSTLLLIPLEPLMKRIPARAGLAGSFCLFMLLRDVNRGWLGFEGVRLAAAPSFFYRNLMTACLGFPPRGFFSTDYFSLLPWFFLFLTGCFLYRLRPEEEQEGCSIPLVTAMGRHSLLIYLAHQPIIYGVLWGVYRLLP